MARAAMGAFCTEGRLAKAQLLVKSWLVKSEPEVYSYADLVRDGGTRWDGVRNFQARNHLRAMKQGDRVLFYHSQTDKAVVGIAEVTREHYADPGAPDEDWSCVDLAPKKAFKRGVTLAEIKATPALANLALIRQSRLSVMPIDTESYALLVKLGG